jgi:hypothetical protein
MYAIYTHRTKIHLAFPTRDEHLCLPSNETTAQDDIVIYMMRQQRASSGVMCRGVDSRCEGHSFSLNRLEERF